MAASPAGPVCLVSTSRSFILTGLLMTTLSVSFRAREGWLTSHVNDKRRLGIPSLTVFQLMHLGSAAFPSLPSSVLPGASSPWIFSGVCGLLASLHQAFPEILRILKSKFPESSNLCELPLRHDSSAFLSAPLLFVLVMWGLWGDTHLCSIWHI